MSGMLAEGVVTKETGSALWGKLAGILAGMGVGGASGLAGTSAGATAGLGTAISQAAGGGLTGEAARAAASAAVQTGIGAIGSGKLNLEDALFILLQNLAPVGIRAGARGLGLGGGPAGGGEGADSGATSAGPSVVDQIIQLLNTGAKLGDAAASGIEQDEQRAQALEALRQAMGLQLERGMGAMSQYETQQLYDRLRQEYEAAAAAAQSAMEDRANAGREAQARYYDQRARYMKAWEARLREFEAARQRQLDLRAQRQQQLGQQAGTMTQGFQQTDPAQQLQALLKQQQQALGLADTPVSSWDDLWMQLNTSLAGGGQMPQTVGGAPVTNPPEMQDLQQTTTGWWGQDEMAPSLAYLLGQTTRRGRGGFGVTTGGTTPWGGSSPTSGGRRGFGLAG